MPSITQPFSQQLQVKIESPATLHDQILQHFVKQMQSTNGIDTAMIAAFESLIGKGGIGGREQILSVVADALSTEEQLHAE
jgi:hypothetical protein